MSIPRSLHLPPGVERATIETDRGSFAALVTGKVSSTRDTAPAPAMLAPGYTGSKEDFLALLPALTAGDRRAVAIDLRGQYETAGPADASAYELAELAADVFALVETLGGAAHLVGHSFGGYVMRLAAATAPPTAAVRSVTLMSSGPGRVTGAATLTNLAMLAGALPTYDMETIWGAKRAIELGRGDPVQAAEIEEFLHARFVRTHPTSLSVAAAQLQADDDRVAGLESLNVPLLVLYGSGEDVWAPAELSAMAARIGAREHVVQGAGHSPAVDDPDATAAALRDFWASVD